MDELSKEYVVSFFDRSLRLHGDRPEAVRWTRQGQVDHYRCLLDMGDISGMKVLDFGCGKGDLYRFLKDRGETVDYTGFDINGSLVALAREKSPEARFEVFDIDRDRLEEDFDCIFLCGVFNLEVQGVEDAIRLTLRRLFSRCRVCLAYNGLSAHNPRRDFELHYSLPGELLTFAIQELSPYVSLRHDRMGYDFTLFVYRNVNSMPEIEPCL
jgi:SAM-dependent methyltransferase